MKSHLVDMITISSIEDLQKVKKLTKELPHKYILKPNREGGGNNIFGEDIYELLNSISLEEAK